MTSIMVVHRIFIVLPSTINGMKELADELNDVLLSLEGSRQQWYTQTRNLLVTELNTVVAELGLDMEVEVNDSIINHETVTLAFRNIPSGLQYNDNHPVNQQDGKSGNLVKYGGTLNFSLVYLGDIIVWMTYPYIRDILENTDDFVDVARIKQDKLNREVIHDAIRKFLNEVIAWHTGKLGKQQRIGFITGSSEG